MIRVLVLANDTLLADAIAWLLTEQVGVDAFQLTHHKLEDEDLHPVVMVLEERKPGDESMFYSFSSLCKTQEREKRDAMNFVWAFSRI